MYSLSTFFDSKLMYLLILSESQMTSSFLSRGLKYENIISDPKSIYEDIALIQLYNTYDGILFKTSKNNDMLEKIISVIKGMKSNIPVYILLNKNQIESFEKIQIPSKHIYPDNIPTRFLAHEIKKITQKQNKNQKDMSLKVHDLKLDLNRREATRNKEKHFLRNKEFQLLEFLMNNVETLLTRQMILENVWDRNAHMLTNTVDVHMNRLRKKIDNKNINRLIETIYCNGYIMHSKPFCNN